MALQTGTTLNGAITATQTVVTLTSGTGAAVGSFIKVDGEFLLIQDITNSPQLLVERGQLSTTAVAHNTLAPSTIGLASDWLPNPPARVITSYNAAGAVTVPNSSQLIWVGGASATALTLASGTAVNAGVVLTFLATSAQAHTLTYTPGFNGDTTSSDVVTFGSKVGAGFSCTCGPTGLWGNPVLSTGTTIG